MRIRRHLSTTGRRPHLTTLVAATLFLSPLAANAQTNTRDRLAPTTASLSAFSASVVVDGGEIFVGRPGGLALFPMPSNRQGGVHIFGRAGGSWAETASVSPDESESAIGYGEGLDASGDLMVVGAPTEGTGAVYVYRRTGGEWALEDRLGWSGAGAATRFGAAVATNGRDIVVGVPGAGSGTGAVVVFAGSGAGWAETAVLQPEELADGAAFGTSLDVEGGLLAVGAPGGAIAMIPGTGGSGPLPGSVHIFDGESGVWSSAGRLEPPDPGPSAMGSSVAISGSEIFVGAPFSGQGAGGIYHFTRSGPVSATWTLAQTIRPSEPVPASGFGMAVAADGDDIVVGTPLAGGGLGGGFAYRRDESGKWAEVADFGSGGPFNFYGLAVAVGGDVAVVGAPGADFFEGAGFLFRRTADGWEPEGTIVDEAAGLEAVRGEERECEEGEAGGFTCSEVDLVAFVPVHDLGGERGMIANDLWGWTDPQSGREYAIMGRADGTTFIDLSDPGNPVYLGELPLTEGAITNMWRDIKVYANHAFVVAGQPRCPMRRLPRARRRVHRPRDLSRCERKRAVDLGRDGQGRPGFAGDGILPQHRIPPPGLDLGRPPVLLYERRDG